MHGDASTLLSPCTSDSRCWSSFTSSDSLLVRSLESRSNWARFTCRTMWRQVSPNGNWRQQSYQEWLDLQAAHLCSFPKKLTYIFLHLIAFLRRESRVTILKGRKRINWLNVTGQVILCTFDLTLLVLLQTLSHTLSQGDNCCRVVRHLQWAHGISFSGPGAFLEAGWPSACTGPSPADKCPAL